MVLDEISGHRHLVISIGEREAFSLAARLQGVEFGRPMTYDFAAALVRGLGGHVRQVRVDRLVEGIYAATVEVEGPLGARSVDARSSDALIWPRSPMRRYSSAPSWWTISRGYRTMTRPKPGCFAWL